MCTAVYVAPTVESVTAVGRIALARLQAVFKDMALECEPGDLGARPNDGRVFVDERN